MTVLYSEKIRITGVFFVDKGSQSGIFPDPDPGDPKRPDPTDPDPNPNPVTLVARQDFADGSINIVREAEQFILPTR